MDEGIIVGEFEKNASEMVRVRLTEFKGHELIDIRGWYEDRETGEMKPGKGITLKRDLLPDLLELLHKAEEVMKSGNKQ